MKRRLTVLASLFLDLLTDGAAAGLPGRVSAFFRLTPRRFLLLPRGEPPVVDSGSGPVQLILHHSDVYETSVPLPGKWGVDPWAVVEMQLHRLSPLKPELVAWDVGTGQAAAGAEARLSLVRRDVLDRALQAAVSVQSVTADTDYAPEFLRLDITRLRRRILRIFSLGLLFWIALPLPLLLACWLVQRQTVAIETELAGLSADVRHTRQLRDRVIFLTQDLGRTSALLVQPERRRILDELAMLLPDDSWIDDLSIQPGGIRLHGQSADATALLDRIRKDPLFSDVRSTAPIMRSPGGNAETFTLALSLAGGGKP
ncbi:MAG TPA: PilN domain-containing protein [Magnetospirillaceae bacterium]|nr:PilN domain-containing protein [Magnetospirillaceae bacterium]